MRHPTAGKFWTAFAALLTTAFAAAPNAKTAPVAPAARPAGAVALKLGHAGSVSAVAFTPDGTLVCVAGMRPEVLHWNPHKRTLSHLDASPPSTRGSVLSPQERWLIAGDDAPSDRGSVVLCDSRTGAEVARMEGSARRAP